MKRYDFDIQAEMSDIVGMLHGMIVYNFERLKRLVKDLSQEEMDARGCEEHSNSIAQLIRHLTVTDIYWVYRLQGQEAVPRSVLDKYGPMYDEEGRLPFIERLHLDTLMQEYNDVQELLREVCLSISDEELEHLVPFERGHRASIRWGLWHIADHSRHHYGQIVLLKKSLRANEAIR